MKRRLHHARANPMFLDFIDRIAAENSAADAIIWRDDGYSYHWLRQRWSAWRQELRQRAVSPSTVVLLEADFSPNAVALLLALIEAGAIVVPLTSALAARKREFGEIAQGELEISIDQDDKAVFRDRDPRADHALYDQLRANRHPGLVLFSSGSTGTSKAALHDLVPLLEKFKVRRHRLRAITFLLFDHIGGFNTLLYTLANGGCLVTARERSPDAVLEAVAKHRVELLPTSPTFINLILLSEAYKRHSLKSLRTVTYGTEPMPRSTLRRFHQLFPEIRLLQTYGLSEVGILRSQSKSADSLWLRLGGEGFETRVVDGLLEIKAASAMLGYLNAPSPFTEDGWFATGDAVEVDGEFYRILGRASEIINVGGEKVYPAEVESVIQEMDNVRDVTVRGEKNPITGEIVCARVTLREDEPTKAFARRLKRFCAERLERYKVPVKVALTEEVQYGIRFKRQRQFGGI